MTNEEFERLYPRYRKFTRAFARRFADFDHDLAEDYEQVGRIALWQFDLSRVQANEESCIKRAIRNSLLNEHYAERRKQIIVPANTSRACKPDCQSCSPYQARQKTDVAEFLRNFKNS